MHSRMLIEFFLDLKRRNILTPSTYRVLYAVNEIVIVLVIAPERVARVIPAVAPRFHGGLGHVLVAGVQRPGSRMPHDQLADGPNWNFSVELIHDPGFEVVWVDELAAGTEVVGVQPRAHHCRHL